jgi:hypothetical protein
MGDSPGVGTESFSIGQTGSVVADLSEHPTTPAPPVTRGRHSLWRTHEFAADRGFEPHGGPPRFRGNVGSYRNANPVGTVRGISLNLTSGERVSVVRVKSGTRRQEIRRYKHLEKKGGIVNLELRFSGEVPGSAPTAGAGSRSPTPRATNSASCRRIKQSRTSSPDDWRTGQTRAETSPAPAADRFPLMPRPGSRAGDPAESSASAGTYRVGTGDLRRQASGTRCVTVLAVRLAVSSAHRRRWRRRS